MQPATREVNMKSRCLVIILFNKSNKLMNVIVHIMSPNIGYKSNTHIIRCCIMRCTHIGNLFLANRSAQLKCHPVHCTKSDSEYFSSNSLDTG